MQNIALISPAILVAAFAFMATPSVAAPAVPAVGDQAGLVQSVQFGGWRCVKRGGCWVACRRSACRKACYPSRRSCRRST